MLRLVLLLLVRRILMAKTDNLFPLRGLSSNIGEASLAQIVPTLLSPGDHETADEHVVLARHTLSTPAALEFFVFVISIAPTSHDHWRGVSHGTDGCHAGRC